jgi:NNP family nitrate/nitrite transporter-like MFS transporter
MGHLKFFLRSGNPKALFAAFIYFDASFMVWVILGALGNFVAAEMGLSGTEKGLVTALPILSGALLRIPMGIAADRWGCRAVGSLGLCLTLVPLATGWLLADRLAEIYLVGLLLGVAGASFAVALPLASKWYPAEHQGVALGIAGAGNSGTVLSSLFAPRLAEAFGWHAVFGLAILPIAASLLLFVLLARDRPGTAIAARPADYLRLLGEADALRFCLFYAITFGGFVGLASYLAIFFKDQYGLAKVTAGDLTAVCVFAGSFARPIGGLLADRLGGVRVLLALLVLVGAAALGLSVLPPLGPAFATFFLVMALLGMGNGAVFQLVPQRFGRRIGVLTGLVGFAGGVGGFALPFLLGLLRDTTGTYATGFALFGLAALAGALLLAGVRKSWRDAGLADAAAAPAGLRALQQAES